MENLIIGKTGVDYADDGVSEIADASEATNLLQGAIAFLEVSGALVDDAGGSAGAIVDPQGMFRIVNGVGGSELIMSTMPINAKTLKYEKKVYVAPVAEVERIGHDGVSAGSLNAPSTLVVGSMIGVRVTKKTRTFFKHEDSKEYTYNLVVGDTIDTATTKLIALMNADANFDITYTTAGSGATRAIIGTGDVAGEFFNLVPTGIIEEATVNRDGATGSVQGLAGYGTYAQIKDLEDKYQAYLGISDTYEKIPGFSNYVSQVAVGGTYTTYSLTWTNVRQEQSFARTGPKTAFGVIAIPSGHSGLITSMDNLLADITA